MLYHHFFSTSLYNVQSGRSKKTKEELELKQTYLLLVYADNVNLLGENIIAIMKNKEALADTSKEVGLYVNKEKTKYMFMSPSPD
jgi:hypothetical protein